MLLFLGIAILAACVGLYWVLSQIGAANRRAATAEQAYSELSAQSAIRERELLDESKDLRRLVTGMNDNADLLATIVRQYAQDLRDTAALLKDEHPPVVILRAEAALRNHDEQVKLRTHGPDHPSAKTAPPV